jgi:hypothetical protein
VVGRSAFQIMAARPGILYKHVEKDTESGMVTKTKINQINKIKIKIKFD